TTWGESHGKALGVTIDGCPAGIPLCEEDIQKELDRRKPGSNPYGTKRKESDSANILSGVFEGKTTGTPISIAVYNADHHSADYSNIADKFRPGHADFGFQSKYGFRDYRGGGRSSGRETLCRVAAGAVAKKILAELGISITAYTVSIGPLDIDRSRMDINTRFDNPLVMPDSEAAKKAAEYLNGCMADCDSAGGIVECAISGVPAGIGEPVFDKLDAVLGMAMFSIGAVKGVEFGAGFEAAKMKGSENNDEFIMEDGKVKKLSNNSGGILGGISDGSDIVFRAAFKPTPSIAKPQQTVTTGGENTEIVIKGRHDPIIVPRAIVVVEAMSAIALTDMIMRSIPAKEENIIKIFKE
ncbi:MAG: chorismate synthase, partial [Clostridiales bacterium]|nr:chorismate synthase [Clostridiales bacterium]